MYGGIIVGTIGGTKGLDFGVVTDCPVFVCAGCSTIICFPCLSSIRKLLTRNLVFWSRPDGGDTTDVENATVGFC